MSTTAIAPVSGSGDWPLLDVVVVIRTPETIGRLGELFPP